MRLAQDVKQDVEDYLQAHGLEASTLSRADYVLALLRIGTPAARREVEAVVGRQITVCPPAIPPWPPRPVAVAPRVARVSQVARNPCLPTSPAFQRYRQIKVGMTREQLMKRGITARDLRKWEKHLQWRTA